MLGSLAFCWNPAEEYSNGSNRGVDGLTLVYVCTGIYGIALRLPPGEKKMNNKERRRREKKETKPQPVEDVNSI